MDAVERLRDLLSSDKITIMAGAFECIGARVIELEGFDALYVTGGGVAASRLGRPDVGLTTLTEMVDTVRNIAGTVSIPVIVDADTGYGNALNAMRAVKELENAGAAGIQIEDQVFPKRCGHFDGKEVVSKGEMVAKITAACEARRDPRTVIVARTDAIAVNGFDDAMDRASAYEKAGADLLFIEAARELDHIRQIPGAFRIPVMFNMAASKKTPSVSVAELEAMGYRIASFAGVGIWAVAKVLREEMRLLKKTGDIESIREYMMPFFDFWEMMGMAEVREAETKYAIR